MRAAAMIAAGVLALTLAGPAPAQLQAYGDAAKVNGVGISNEVLERSFEEYLRDQGMNIGAMRYPNRVKTLKHEALDLLIDQEVTWQAAQKKGVIATPEEIDQAVAEMQSQFKSKDDFVLKLKMEGYTEEDYREHMKHLVSARKYLDETVGQIEVSDAEVHAFYEANPDKFTLPEAVHARHILIRLDPSASEQDKKAAREKLAGILKEARGGADFAELAKKYSQDASAENGGDLGYFPRGQMIKPFEDAAFSLEPGEISDIVETPFGLHLIKVEDHKPPQKVPEDKVSDKVRTYLQGQKQSEAINKEIARLRSEADIEILLPL